MGKTDFDGGRCVVLPKNYLQSAQAVSEIYEDQLTKVATNLEIDSLSKKRGFFRGCLLAALLWALPSFWTICS